MADFTVRVELRGSHIDGDEYARLHGLMGIEGFDREVSLKSRLQSPAGWAPIGGALQPASHPMPHATYFGQYNEDASKLLRHLVGRIVTEIQPEVVVFVAQTSDYAIHP
jgi:hypothetical protein